MPGSGESRANVNRRIKREATLEDLRNKGLLQQVIETNNKLSDLDKKLESVEVQRLRAANDGRLALIKKYLPDVKQTELTGKEGDPIEMNLLVEFIDPNTE